MTQSLLPTHSMESKRILYSDKHFHTLELSEQTMGILQYALYVLHHAFIAEPEYLKLIDDAAERITKTFERRPTHRL